MIREETKIAEGNQGIVSFARVQQMGFTEIFFAIKQVDNNATCATETQTTHDVRDFSWHPLLFLGRHTRRFNDYFPLEKINTSPCATGSIKRHFFVVLSKKKHLFLFTK